MPEDAAARAAEEIPRAAQEPEVPRRSRLREWRSLLRTRQRPGPADWRDRTALLLRVVLVLVMVGAAWIVRGTGLALPALFLVLAGAAIREGLFWYARRFPHRARARQDAQLAATAAWAAVVMTPSRDSRPAVRLLLPGALARDRVLIAPAADGLVLSIAHLPGAERVTVPWAEFAEIEMLPVRHGLTMDPAMRLGLAGADGTRGVVGTIVAKDGPVVDREAFDPLAATWHSLRNAALAVRSR